MSTLLLVRIAGNDAADVVSQAAESPGFGDHRTAFFVIVGLATVAGLHLMSKAIAPIAKAITSIVVAGLGVLLVVAAVGLAFALAITAV